MSLLAVVSRASPLAQASLDSEQGTVDTGADTSESVEYSGVFVPFAWPGSEASQRVGHTELLEGSQTSCAVTTGTTSRGLVRSAIYCHTRLPNQALIGA